MSPRPIRVAHLVATAGRSGVESHLEALLPAFDPREVETRLLVPGPGPLVDTLTRLGVRVEPGAPTRKLAWGEARALGARLRGTCDIVHAHGPRVAFWARTVADAAGAPFVVATLHELRWLSLPPGPRRWAWTALEAFANGRADRLTTSSSAALAAVRARHPEWASRLSLLHGTAPLLADPPVATHANAKTGPLRIICVARFHWVKGHAALLEAVAHARATGLDVELTLVGDGPLADTLRAQADALGLAAHVHWPGPVFDARAVLPAHDLYVSASHSEVFGVAPMEAMACGLPVIAPALGGFLDLIEDGVSGRLVPERTSPTWAQALADAIVDAARDRDALRTMGLAGARRARERFAPNVCAAATTALYRTLVPARD